MSLGHALNVRHGNLGVFGFDVIHDACEMVNSLGQEKGRSEPAP